ncbi:hypothetical protein ACFFIX_27110 [Metabacillus herbersteinensis]|uniref:Uncharacterized protein n=1 Tax=Metabacillus herbersteinensis TaxID=283816 RepID=A0ABV6GPF2_9BACI
MELDVLTNKELAKLYVEYKQKIKLPKKRKSFYNLNKCIEIKKYLSLIKWEMEERGLKKKEAKKLSNF